MSTAPPDPDGKQPALVFLCERCLKPVCRNCSACECPDMPHVPTNPFADEALLEAYARRSRADG